MFSATSNSRLIKVGLNSSLGYSNVPSQIGIVGNNLEIIEKPSTESIQNQYQILNTPTKISNPIVQPEESIFNQNTKQINNNDKNNKVLNIEAVTSPLKKGKLSVKRKSKQNISKKIVKKKKKGNGNN